MYHKFLLMRHACSKHNTEKDKWKGENGDKSYKLKPEFKLIKFNPQYIDSSQINISQCEQARDKYIDFDKVKLIITSPLRRCLQTCRILIKGREKQFRVIVQPLLVSRLANAWSIGSDVKILKEAYQDYDFSSLEQNQQFWPLNLFKMDRKCNVKQFCSKNQNFQQKILQYIELEQGQTYKDFFNRTRILKQRLLQIISKQNLTDITKDKILIISHSCVLNFLLGKELNQKGKVKDKVGFHHCIPKQFNSGEVLYIN